MSYQAFGELFKEHRIKCGKTLRQFCIENGFDPGNISKLERGILPPPESRAKLELYAKALNIQTGDSDWFDFFDLADIARGQIPNSFITGKEVMARLPLVFRTIGNKQMDGDEIDHLIEIIKRS